MPPTCSCEDVLAKSTLIVRPSMAYSVGCAAVVAVSGPERSMLVSITHTTGFDDPLLVTIGEPGFLSGSVFW